MEMSKLDAPSMVALMVMVFVLKFLILYLKPAPTVDAVGIETVQFTEGVSR